MKIDMLRMTTLIEQRDGSFIVITRNSDNKLVYRSDAMTRIDALNVICLINDAPAYYEQTLNEDTQEIDLEAV